MASRHTDHIQKLQRIWCAGIPIRAIRYTDLLGLASIRRQRVLPWWEVLIIPLIVGIPIALRHRFLHALSAAFAGFVIPLAGYLVSRQLKYRAIQHFRWVQAAQRRCGRQPNGSTLPIGAIINQSLYYTWRDYESVRIIRCIYCILVSLSGGMVTLLLVKSCFQGKVSVLQFLSRVVLGTGVFAALFGVLGVPAIICEWITGAKLARWERQARATWDLESKGGTKKQ